MLSWRVPIPQEADWGADTVRGAGEPGGALRAPPAHLQGPGVHLQVHRPLPAPLCPVSATRVGAGLGAAGGGPAGSLRTVGARLEPGGLRVVPAAPGAAASNCPRLRSVPPRLLPWRFCPFSATCGASPGAAGAGVGSTVCARGWGGREAVLREDVRSEGCGDGRAPHHACKARRQ